MIRVLIRVVVKNKVLRQGWASALIYEAGVQSFPARQHPICDWHQSYHCIFILASSTHATRMRISYYYIIYCLVYFESFLLSVWSLIIFDNVGRFISTGHSTKAFNMIETRSGSRTIKKKSNSNKQALNARDLSNILLTLFVSTTNKKLKKDDIIT